MINCRKARPEDMDTLLAFEQGIIAYERPFDSTLKEDPISYYDLAAFFSNPNKAIIIAEEDGKIIGSGHVRIRPSRPYCKDELHAFLGFMYVDPDYRGRGVNKLITKELIDWSKANGYNEIKLTVYADNESAIRAYEKAGFKKHIIEMRYDPTLD